VGCDGAPVDSHDRDDPVEILTVLSESYRAQFLAKYTVAIEGARRPEYFREDFARRTAAAWARDETR
jgi:hypothetical protein